MGCSQNYGPFWLQIILRRLILRVPKWDLNLGSAHMGKIQIWGGGGGLMLEEEEIKFSMQSHAPSFRV